MASNLTERDRLGKMAELHSRTGRYDDMLKSAKLFAQRSTASKPLTEDEKSMLSIAYKNCVGARRTGWKNVYRIEKMENEGNHVRRQEMVYAYRKTIENELVAMCKELIQLLDKRLIVRNMDDETAVFYYKMKGDYSRYIAEVTVDNKTMADNHVTIAEAAYKEADARAVRGLSDTHPLRLGLALNYSVFLYEMKKDHVTAIQVAKQRYDEALDEINGVPVIDQTRYGECRNLLTLLHENLKTWTGTR